MKISDKYSILCDSDFDNIKKVLETKKFSGTSEIVKKYEKKLASFFGSKYATATSSGTTAIQTALFIAGVSSGDEVIITSTCPSMSVFPIIFAGAKPVFCDTEVDNFGLKIDDIEKSISTRTKVIIEVPMWGYPTDVKKLSDFAKSKKLPLILDLAQAHGTKLNEKYLSSYGDISCFSTHDRKIIATGEGGFILTDNKEYHERTVSFIQFGNMNGIDFGLNYKLGALQAGLGMSRIDYVKEQLEKRNKNAKYIVNNIKNNFVEEFKIIDRGNPNYYSLLLMLTSSNNLRIIKLLDERGVPSDVVRYNYKLLYEYPIFKRFKKICVNSEKLVKNITTIPVHPALSGEELEYIVDQINNIK